MINRKKQHVHTARTHAVAAAAVTTRDSPNNVKIARVRLVEEASVRGIGALSAIIRQRALLAHYTRLSFTCTDKALGQLVLFCDAAISVPTLENDASKKSRVCRCFSHGSCRSKIISMIAIRVFGSNALTPPPHFRADSFNCPSTFVHPPKASLFPRQKAFSVLVTAALKIYTWVTNRASVKIPHRNALIAVARIPARSIDRDTYTE